MYSTCVFDTQSGERLLSFEAAAGSWQRGRVIDQTHVVPLPALGLTRTEAHDVFGKDRPRDRTLSVLYRNEPIYHGLIIDSDYDVATGNLTVVHRDVRELAAARWLFGIGGSSQTFQWSGMSWRGIARAVARLIYTAPISGAWPLPVSIGPEEAGTRSLRTFGYEFKTGEDLFTDIEEMPGGPDLDFHPTLVNGAFGWEFVTGDPYLTGPTFEFHLQSQGAQLENVKVKTIGNEKVTGVHGIGEGSEWDMVRGGAAAPVAAGLARDTKLTLKSDKLASVNDRSEAFLNTRLNTYQQWSFTARTDSVDLRTLRLGSLIRVHSQGDRWIPDGWSEHRVLAFDGAIENPDVINLVVETI